MMAALHQGGMENVKQWIAFLLLAVLSALLAGCVARTEPPSSTSNTRSEPSAVTEPTVLPAASVLNVWCFQAGKADAFLFWNESGAILIDTGESGFGKVVLSKLEALGISRLNALIVTHFDKDHVGGAKKLLTSIPVDAVLQSNCPKPDADAYEKYLDALTAKEIEPVTVRKSMELTLGDVVFAVNPPVQETYPEDASNNSSLIVTVKHGENQLLFCGDAEELRLAEFLENDPGLCTLVKLPHHGRYQATLQELLTATRPLYAVVTSSDEEPEDAETQALLERENVQVFYSRVAPILIQSDGSQISVQYCKE